MSKYYNPKRTRNLFNPNSREPFKLSRSKMELFINCPRCFYLDRRLGVGQPPGFPFSLNTAVDTLLKKEFDFYRERQEPHPIMVEYGVIAVPFLDPRIDSWRNALSGGILFHHRETNLVVGGGIDDVWINKSGELIIADYKSTSKDGEIKALDQDWHDCYRRQMEIYQWLFRKNNFKVNSTGYFVYCNADTSKERFDGHLVFDITLVPHVGDDSWIENILIDAKKCLMSEKIPESDPNCDFCSYRDAAKNY